MNSCPGVTLSFERNRLCPTSQGRGHRTVTFNPPLIEDCTASFLPVEVVAEPPIIDPPVIEPKAAKIEISLSNGHHIRVIGAYDPDALCRLVRGLR